MAWQAPGATDDKPAAGGAVPSVFSGGGRSGLSSITSAFKRSLGEHAPEMRMESKASEKFSILVAGTKHAGKSASLADLPRPNGGRTVFISFDAATYSGIKTMWGVDWMKENRVEVYEVTKAIPDIGYPGYDPTRPATAESVLGYTAYILEELEEAGDVDNIILDHFQAAHEDIGVSYCRHLAGVTATEKIDFRAYGPRKPMLRLLRDKAWNIARHAICMTGYKDEETVTMQKAGGKTEIGTVIRDCRWLQPYQAPFEITLEPYYTMEKIAGGKGESHPKYYWYVAGSKSSVFPLGETMDLTGKGINHFWKLGEELEGATDAVS